jgi:hypothetical protein
VSSVVRRTVALIAVHFSFSQTGISTTSNPALTTNFGQNNVIRNNASGPGGITVDGTDGLIFVQNLVYGNAAVGEINVPLPSGGGGLTIGVPGNGRAPYYGIIANNTFFNNTVGSTQYVSSQVYLDGDISKYLFANNIVYSLQTFPAIACSDPYSYLSPAPS